MPDYYEDYLGETSPEIQRFKDKFKHWNGGGGEWERVLTDSDWIKLMGMSDEELQKYLSILMQKVSTQTAQQKNEITGYNAMTDASESTAAARLRGADIRGQKALTEGTAQLEQYQNQANRQAWGNIYASKMIDQQNEQNKWNAITGLLGNVGQAAGTYFGLKSQKRGE